MATDEKALELVGLALEAATGDRLWPEVLERIARVFGADAAKLGDDRGTCPGPRHLLASVAPDEWLSVSRRPTASPFAKTDVELFSAIAPLIARAVRLSRTPKTPSPAARTFQLTPSEARIAGFIAQGHGLFETAAELGISRNTARTHMKRIYAKTGARRQGDLVRLLKEM